MYHKVVTYPLLTFHNNPKYEHKKTLVAWAWDVVSLVDQKNRKFQKHCCKGDIRDLLLLEWNMHLFRSTNSHQA